MMDAKMRMQMLFTKTLHSTTLPAIPGAPLAPLQQIMTLRRPLEHTVASVMLDIAPQPAMERWRSGVGAISAGDRSHQGTCCHCQLGGILSRNSSRCCWTTVFQYVVLWWHRDLDIGLALIQPSGITFCSVQAHIGRWLLASNGSRCSSGTFIHRTFLFGIHITVGSQHPRSPAQWNKMAT